jgi:hypothetical protein
MIDISLGVCVEDGGGGICLIKSFSNKKKIKKNENLGDVFNHSYSNKVLLLFE